MNRLSCRILAHIVSHFYNHCCKIWSAQAWKLLGNAHVPKPASAQARIHLQCTRSVQACTHAVHKLGTGLGTGVFFKLFPSLGTPTSTAVNGVRLHLCVLKVPIICTVVSHKSLIEESSNSHHDSWYFMKRS